MAYSDDSDGRKHVLTPLRTIIFINIVMSIFRTGEPLYNCIVWLDNRTSDIVDSVLDNIPGRDLNWLKKKTGLPISTYFTAFKLKWLLTHQPEVRRALAENRLMFGTVDSWLLWKLTGVHATDVTNASRTLLMDIETLDWDADLCKFFDIPLNILPRIEPSSYQYGTIRVGAFTGLPITGKQRTGCIFQPMTLSRRCDR